MYKLISKWFAYAKPSASSDGELKQYSRAAQCALVIVLYFAFSVITGACAAGLPPTEILNLISKAQKLRDNQNWEGAKSSYEELVKLNPYRGAYYEGLGRAAYALSEYEISRDAYERAFQLGYEEKVSALGVAMNYVALGDAERSAAWLERALRLDPSWVTLLPQAFPEIAEALGPDLMDSVFGPFADPSLSREDRWRVDLSFLQKHLLHSHYDAFLRTSEEEWRRAAERISNDIPRLTNNEIALEFSKFAALAGDGHTNVWFPDDTSLQVRRVPAYIIETADGVFILGADEKYRDIVGARITRIGGLSIDDVLDRTDVYFGHENAMHKRLVRPYVLSSFDVLKQIGAATGENVRLRLELPNGKTRTRVLEPVSWSSPWWNGKSPPPDGWITFEQGAGRKQLLALSRPDEAYWKEYLDTDKILFFRYNQIHERDKKPFAEFVDELFETMSTKEVKALVIDLRGNDGGDTSLYRPILQKLIENRDTLGRGKLFVLIGPSTYSAAMNLAVDLEYWTNAIFIGEPTGSSINFVGENKLFTLPNSGLSVSVSDRYHQHGASDSTDARIWLAPDIVAPLTFAKIREGNDPAIEAVRNILAGVRAAR